MDTCVLPCSLAFESEEQSLHLEGEGSEKVKLWFRVKSGEENGCELASDLNRPRSKASSPLKRAQTAP